MASTLPWYNKDGDQIECKWDDVAEIAEWVNPLLTIYRSAEDPTEIIGFEVRQPGKIIADGLKPVERTPEEEARIEAAFKTLGRSWHARD